MLLQCLSISLLPTCQQTSAFSFRHVLLNVMPRSHIHGSHRGFHYGSNLTDDPGNAIFRSPIRMHNGVATSFDVSAKAKIVKEHFSDMIDTVLLRSSTERHGLIRE